MRSGIENDRSCRGLARPRELGQQRRFGWSERHGLRRRVCRSGVLPGGRRTEGRGRRVRLKADITGVFHVSIHRASAGLPVSRNQAHRSTTAS
jgi:hypothetical protein